MSRFVVWIAGLVLFRIPLLWLAVWLFTSTVPWWQQVAAVIIIAIATQ